MNDYNLGLADLKCGAAKWSVLRAPFFLLYINDLNQGISFSKVYYFADDANLSHLRKYTKKQSELTWLKN